MDTIYIFKTISCYKGGGISTVDPFCMQASVFLQETSLSLTLQTGFYLDAPRLKNIIIRFGEVHNPNPIILNYFS